MSRTANTNSVESGPTRRSFLAAVAGGVAALSARAIARTPAARADDGDPVIIGQDNIATNSTQVSSAAGDGLIGYAQTPGRAGVWGQDATVTPPGVGVKGTSSLGDGVQGFTPAAAAAGVYGQHTGVGPGVLGRTGAAGSGGVLGENTGAGNGVIGIAGDVDSSGVLGQNSGGYGVTGTTGGADRPGVLGENTGGGIGVQGTTDGPVASGVLGDNTGGGFGVRGVSGGTDAVGVYGETTNKGVGVRARATDNGVGMLAENTGSGTALQVEGKAVFSRSGIATILGGASSVTVSGVDITGASLIFALLQKRRSGKHVEAVDPSPSTDSFTIWLNRAVSSSTKVAWFIAD